MIAEPTHHRRVAHTSNFCLADLKSSPGSPVVPLTVEKVNELLGALNLKLRYINAPDKQENPDGYIGYLELIEYK